MSEGALAVLAGKASDLFPGTLMPGRGHRSHPTSGSQTTSPRSKDCPPRPQPRGSGLAATSYQPVQWNNPLFTVTDWPLLVPTPHNMSMLLITGQAHCTLQNLVLCIIWGLPPASPLKGDCSCTPHIQFTFEG